MTLLLLGKKSVIVNVIALFTLLRKFCLSLLICRSERSLSCDGSVATSKANSP